MELAEAVCAIAELSMVKDRLRGMMAFLLMLALSSPARGLESACPDGRGCEDRSDARVDLRDIRWYFQPAPGAPGFPSVGI